MTLSAQARNKKIYDILYAYLDKADSELEFKKPFDVEEVEELFTTSIWGHRELVLTILLTRLVFPEYKATKDLYRHSPRSVYEKPIRKAFREFGIPHRKSGPLNVAKNISKIDMNWAENKNEESVAKCAVLIVQKMEQVSPHELQLFAKAYISRYEQEAGRIKDYEVQLEPQENPIFLNRLSIDLITNVPDGGATAQFITGLLMYINNTARQSAIEVNGYKDSVSTTNTTSKKPGDVIESLGDKSVELVYEVTTKAFDENRLIESHESVIAYNKNIKDVFVLCTPSDVPSTLEVSPNSYLMASTQYQQLSYYFISINEFIKASLLFLPSASRREYYELLIDYINDINRSESVKVYFKKWHETEPS